MKEKIRYSELEKKVRGNSDYTEQDYIDFFTYYCTKGYKEYNNDEKISFYITLQYGLISRNKISGKLLDEIDDLSDELDCGTAEVDPNYFNELDQKLIKVLKEHGFLKE